MSPSLCPCLLPDQATHPARPALDDDQPHVSRSGIPIDAHVMPRGFQQMGPPGARPSARGPRSRPDPVLARCRVIRPLAAASPQRFEWGVYRGQPMLYLTVRHTSLHPATRPTSTRNITIIIHPTRIKTQYNLIPPPPPYLIPAQTTERGAVSRTRYAPEDDHRQRREHPPPPREPALTHDGRRRWRQRRALLDRT